MTSSPALLPILSSRAFRFIGNNGKYPGALGSSVGLTTMYLTLNKEKVEGRSFSYPASNEEVILRTGRRRLNLRLSKPRHFTGPAFSCVYDN